MEKLFFLSLILFAAKNVLSFPELNQPKVSENLAARLAELTKNIDQTTKTLENNVDFVIKSALRELSQPIQDFQNKVLAIRCQPFFTFERLGQNIESDLDKCTQNLNAVLNNFQKEMNDYNMALDRSVLAINGVSKACAVVTNASGFGSSSTCYIAKISEIYRDVESILNNADMTVSYTNQLAEQAVKSGKSCSDNVVVNTNKLMDKIWGYCQVVEN